MDSMMMDLSDMASQPLASDSFTAGSSFMMRGSNHQQTDLFSNHFQQPSTFTMGISGGPPTAAETGTTMPSSFLPPAEANPPPFESLDERIERQDREILHSLLDKVRERNRRKTQELVDRQLNRAWERNRELWMQEIKGTRGAPPLLLDPNQAHRRQGSGTSLMRQEDASRNTAFSAHQEAALDPNVVQMHRQIIRSSNDSHQVIRNFQQHFDGSSGQPSDAGYAVAWRLVGELARLPSPSNGVQRAMATMTYLCRQLLTIIYKQVQNAEINKQDLQVSQDFRSETATLCAKFVKLTLGDIHTSNNTRNWPLLYYCLRCGDAIAALEVFQSGTLGTLLSESVVVEMLTELAAAQGKSPCMWDIHSIPYTRPELRQEIESLLSSLDAQDTESSAVGIYQKGFLSLLAGENLPTSNDDPGFGTIEDYLAGVISRALLQEEPELAVKEVADMIDSYGASYFGIESGGWGFAWPLLVTQQYRKALSHLANIDGSAGLLQATHLALLLDASGVDVDDIGSTSTAENFATVLLVAYAADLLTIDVSCSAPLEYIARIPDRRRRRKEAALLMTRFDSPEKLQNIVGSLGSDGKRNAGSLLDRYFSADDVDGILDETGDIMCRDSASMNLQCAVLCYSLGGSYAKTLNTMNRQLCPPSTIDPERMTWINLSNQFHKYYLLKSSYVVDTLKREQKEGLINASRLLLLMNEMFLSLRSENYAEAWKFAMKTELVPSSEEDAPLKEDQYNRLDPIVKEAFPDFIVGVMRTLQHEHRFLKRGESQGRGSSVGTERIRQVERIGRLLVRFSSLVRMESFQVETISRLEALMR